MENIGILPCRKKSVRYNQVSAITRCPLYRVSAIDRYDCNIFELSTFTPGHI